jgi:hypothetical protein
LSFATLRTKVRRPEVEVRMRRFGLLVTVALVGCNGSGTASVHFSMEGTLEAGQEIERCKLFVAPPEGLNIYKEQISYSAGSHHVLLYATSYASFPETNTHGMPVAPETVYDCPDGAPADFKVSSVLGGAQSANAPPVIDLPSDTAVKVPGGTVIVMNTHYLNATPHSLDTTASIDVYTIPDAQVKHEAGMIFFYDPIIRVPAGATAQARMACPVNRDYQIFNLQTHMHKRGLGGLANLTDSDGNVLQQLYQSSDWENVNVQKYDDLHVSPGQMLDYRCNYDSHEDHTVLQGLTTKDEMCMLIGAYTPHNTAFEYCSPDGTSGAKGFSATFYGSGTATCMDSVKCVEGALATPQGGQQDDVLYGCILNSCERAAKPFNAAVRCAALEFDGSCKSTCNGQMSDGCRTCLESACATEMSGCAATSCN